MTALPKKPPDHHGASRPLSNHHSTMAQKTRRGLPYKAKCQITIPEVEDQMLRHLAVLTGFTVSELASRAISDWLLVNYRDRVDLYTNRPDLPEIPESNTTAPPDTEEIPESTTTAL